MNVRCAGPGRAWMLTAVALLCGGRAALAVRVAVVTDGGTAVGQVIDLAQAKMASDVHSQVQFVERASIKKIFDEQKLSLSGAVDAGEAVKVGQLLGAEFLAVVETDDEHANATGVVLFDARTGVRFEDDGLRGADEKTADALADSLRAGLRKAALPLNKRRPICMLTVRNVNLPKSQDAFCGAVARLVERRLLASPDVVVLERERLNEVRKEEALHPETGDKSELIASVVMMELQLERDNGQIRATCVLSDSGGKRVAAPVSAAGAGGQAEDIAEGLAAKIGAALQVTAAPMAADDAEARKAEALRFYHEARFWWTHHDYVRPVESMEAAVALDPKNALLQAQLARALTLSGISRIGDFNDYGTETGRNVFVFIKPGLEPGTVLDSLGLAEAGIQSLLVQGNVPSTVESAKITTATRALLMAYLAGIESEQELRAGHGRLGPQPPLTAAEQLAAVREIRGDYWTLLRRDAGAPAMEDVADWKSAVAATSGLQAILADPAFYNTAPRTEVIAELEKLIAGWKNMWAAGHPPKGSPSIKAIVQLLDPKQLEDELRHIARFTRPGGELSSSERESLLPLYETLAQINDPQCAATAARGIAWATPPGGQQTGGSIPSQWIGAGSFRVAKELKPARGGTPIIVAPSGPTWTKKLLLLDVASKVPHEEKTISRPIAHGEYIYTVETTDYVHHTLLKVDPLHPAVTQPPEILADARGRPSLVGFEDKSSSIAGGYYIFADHALILFSLDGKKSISLDAAHGFHFRAGKVTVVDGRVYASDEGNQGMLIEYDIKGQTMKTIAASKRTAVQSPFDNLPPMKVSMLLPDPARHRILFYAMGAEWPKNLSGLWEYNTKTGTFKQLISSSSDAVLGFDAFRPHEIAGGNKCIFGGRIFDLATDAFTRFPDAAAWENQHALAEQSPRCLTDHYGWTTWGRVRLPDGLLQGFPHLAIQAGRDSEPVGYFPLDDDRMIAYGNHSIWLVEPPKYTGLAPTPLVSYPDEGLPPAIVPPEGGELPWSAMHVIYDHFRDVEPIDTYTSPKAVGDRIFVLGIGHDEKKALRLRSGSPEEMTEGFAELLSFGRDGSAAKTLGKLEITGVRDERPPEYRFTKYSTPPAVTALGRHNYYAAMAGEACIGIFPLDGSAARKIAIPESPQHLVTMGGQLYGAIDHSFLRHSTAALSHIDPASGKVETLIPTTLVQSANGPTHYPIISGLWSDPPRGRLLYIAHGEKPDPAADGIWEWKLATHQKRLLLPLYVSDGKNDPLGSSEIVWTGSTADGRPLVASRRGLFEFDPANDSAKAIMQRATLLDPLAPTAITLTRRTVPQSANDLLSGGIFTEMPYAVADGFLWFANGRCSLDGKIFEQFPPFRSGRQFFPDDIQFLDGGTHCLVSDEYGAWLLDIKK